MGDSLPEVLSGYWRNSRTTEIPYARTSLHKMCILGWIENFSFQEIPPESPRRVRLGLGKTFATATVPKDNQNKQLLFALS